MKILKYCSYVLTILISLSIFVFINLGNYLDITEKPKKSDVIISLGGGSLERVKKSLELYTNSYASKNILILTGDDRTKKQKNQNKDDKRIKFLKENTFTELNIIHNPNLKSTEDEINYINTFLQKNQYKSAMIISDSPHSKRISILLNYIVKDKKINFNLPQVKSDWWNKKHYFKNKRSLKFAIRELFKITYTHITYGILYKIGLKEQIHQIKEYIIPIQKEIEKHLILYIN